MSKLKNKTSHGRSPFALGLKALIDEADFYTREQWSNFLGVTPSAISQWVNDKTLPRPDLLRLVLDLLQNRGNDKAKEALVRFERLMEEPAEKISPLGSRMLPNLAEFMRGGTFLKFGRSLANLPPEKQIAALESGGLVAAPTASLSPANVASTTKKGPAIANETWVDSNSEKMREKDNLSSLDDVVCSLILVVPFGHNMQSPFRPTLSI